MSAISQALLEIGVEEIPARFIDQALADLKVILETDLQKSGLAFTSVECAGTPRRLTAIINGLTAKAADRVDEALGPPPKAAKDDAGQWTQAALGFAKAQKIPVEKLILKQTPKGERWVALHPVKGQKTEILLKEIFPRAISTLTFPKSMVWEETRFRFARPIRWIVALYNSKVIRFKIAGVSSDKTSQGLFALGGQKIPISKASAYKLALKGRCVLIDPKERLAKIEKDLDTLAKKVKCRPIATTEHLREVVNLTAYPVGILGQFNETYLSLPREVLVLVLKKHQKFFPLETAKGQMSNYFVGVRNGPSDYQEEVRDGYERVVHARFADAKFFFEHDAAHELETLVPKLSGVGFHEKIGHMKDKTDRIVKFVEILAPLLNVNAEVLANARRAALLSKTDLLTQIVGELPELQGVAGRFYAEGKEHKNVAAALEQHYWPLTSEGDLPSVLEAAMVAVADKMDTLAADFSVGLAPSGSADPYGLRRLAIGLVRILIDQKWPVTLDQLLDIGFKLIPGEDEKKKSSLRELRAFILGRFSNLYKERGFRPDEIEAVTSSANQSVSVMLEKLKCLKAVRGKTEFESLAQALKRARNILQQAKEKNLRIETASFDSATLQAAEKSLFEAVQAAQAPLNIALMNGRFAEAFTTLAALKGPVDAFFDGVMVMVEDEALRAQRLGLLALVKDLFDRVADFSKLQVAAVAVPS